MISFVLALAIAVSPGTNQGITIELGEGHLDLPRAEVMAWVKRAETAVVTYFGGMMIGSVLVRIIVMPGGHGIMKGTTWGDRAGYPAMIRIEIGEHATLGELADDWTMTHELVHTMFPDVDDAHTWLSEGIATYVEPVARVQAHELTDQRVWSDMVRDMPQGEPGMGDLGLSRTSTWARTYWGGALFLLDADVRIIEATHGRKSLRDALRAIADAHGTINHDWPVARVLAVGDQATGTTVLRDLYAHAAMQPAIIDLAALWKKLGLVVTDGALVRLEASPIRNAITASPEQKL